MARTAKPRTTPDTRDDIHALRHIPRPDDYANALAEAETLAGLLLGLHATDREADQAAALRSRGWALFHIDGETALPPAVVGLHPLLIREYLRLQALVRDLITPDVLAAYQTRRSIAKARHGAEYIRHRLERIETLLGQPDGIASPELPLALGAIEEAVLPWLAATEFAARWIAGTQQPNQGH